MNLYLENGYPNYDFINQYDSPFIMIIGPRGTGKTFLTKRIYQDFGCFLFVVRTKKKLEYNLNKITTPFKKLLPECEIVANDEMGIIYENDVAKEENKAFCLCVNINTFNNLTGVAFDDITAVVFDEFTPQKRDRPIKGEFQGYKNIMELVYRNNFDKKVKTFFFGNSNTMQSQIIIGYRLVKPLFEMYQNHETIRYIPDKLMTIVLLLDSPISEKKAMNDFYRSIGRHNAEMELDNTFTDLSVDYVKHQNLKEYVPELITPAFTLWGHKSKDIVYVTNYIRAGGCTELGNTPASLDYWQHICKVYYNMYVKGFVYFASYDIQCDFLQSFSVENWNLIK